MIPVHDSIPSVVAELLRNQPLSPAKIDFAWQAAVGPAMARATSVTLAEGGELTVVVSDRHWKREVAAAVPLIVPRLERLLGTGVVGKVVVKVAGREARPRSAHNSRLNT